MGKLEWEGGGLCECCADERPTHPPRESHLLESSFMLVARTTRFSAALKMTASISSLDRTATLDWPSTTTPSGPSRILSDSPVTTPGPPAAGPLVAVDWGGAPLVERPVERLVERRSRTFLQPRP